MAVLGDARIAVGILIPEEIVLVAGPTDFERVGERLVLAGRIEHQVHGVAHVLADGVNGGDLAFDIARLVAATPAVDLEAGVA